MAKKILVFIGNASPEYQKQFEASPTHEIINASVDYFPSKERFFELFFGQDKKANENREKLNGAKAVIVQSTSKSGILSTDEECMDLLRAVHTLKNKRNGAAASEVTVVLPFAAFDRQDRPFDNRFVSMTADLFATLLKAAGADRVVRITPHSNKAIEPYRDAFGDNLITLDATELFAARIRAQYGNDLGKIAIGAPDGAEKENDEGQRRALKLAKALFGDLPEDELKKHMFFIEKKHVGVSKTEINREKSIADVAGKHCIILDDMIDGGGTVTNASVFLKERGALSVSGCATHGVFTNDALNNLLSAKTKNDVPLLDHLIATDTIATVNDEVARLHPDKAARVEVLSTAPMVMQALEQLPALSQSKKIAPSGR